MPNLPDANSLEALRAWDTPTICNALEIVVPARRAFGFTRRPLVAPFPELKPIVGFARTAMIRSRAPHPRGRNPGRHGRETSGGDRCLGSARAGADRSLEAARLLDRTAPASLSRAGRDPLRKPNSRGAGLSPLSGCLRIAFSGHRNDTGKR